MAGPAGTFLVCAACRSNGMVRTPRANQKGMSFLMLILLRRLSPIVLGFIVCALVGCGKARMDTTDDRDPAKVLASADSLPDWARSGAVRSARWDGGPAEAEKGRLSGWPNYTLEDRLGVMAATRDWYNPRTVEFLKMAHVNWAWVTWSVGFSHQTEKPQWEVARRYIEVCHKSGIKVTAYMSIANMFWKDMFQNEPASRDWVQILPDGSPFFYSPPHRYMADISRREWLDYLKVRVRGALAAGADGFWIDNTFEPCGAANVQKLLAEIYLEAAHFGRKIVINSNYNNGIFTWARLQNSITTEDGVEPGFYPEEPEGQRLVTNVGLLRYHYGISEGWRPVSVEYGGRYRGNRLTTPMEPNKWQLSLAECQAFQASLEPFFEGLFLTDLYNNKANAMGGLKAIGQYNSFFEKHQQYYANPRSAARIAVISDTTDRVVPLLNRLAAFNLQFDVLFNYQTSALEKLRSYPVVLAPHTNPLSNQFCAALAQFVKNGGTFIAIQDASLFGLLGESRADFGLAGVLGISMRRLPSEKTVVVLGRGKAIYYPFLPDAAKLAFELKSLVEADEAVEVEVPQNVLYNVLRQERSRRLLVHLLNYTQKRLTDIKIRVRGKVTAAQVLSPDGGLERPIRVVANGPVTSIEVPELLTYDLVPISIE